MGNIRQITTKRKHIICYIHIFIHKLCWSNKRKRKRQKNYSEKKKKVSVFSKLSAEIRVSLYIFEIPMKRSYQNPAKRLNDEIRRE